MSNSKEKLWYFLERSTANVKCQIQKRNCDIFLKEALQMSNSKEKLWYFLERNTTNVKCKRETVIFSWKKHYKCQIQKRNCDIFLKETLQMSNAKEKLWYFLERSTANVKCQMQKRNCDIFLKEALQMSNAKEKLWYFLERNTTNVKCKRETVIFSWKKHYKCQMQNVIKRNCDKQNQIFCNNDTVCLF